MRKLFLLLSMCAFGIIAQAQIICADTVYADSSVTYSASAYATTYNWKFGTASSMDVPIGSPSMILTGSPLSSPVFSAMVNDNGHWYCFTANYSGFIVRIDFGSNPPTSSSFTTTTYSGLGFSSSRLEGIEVIKDSAANKWYLFAVNDNQLLRMSFGSSLSGTHTDTMMTLGSAIAWPHQVSIKKYGSEWVAFVACRGDKLVRLDFGTSITNVPAVTQIPVVGSYNSSCNFALHTEGGNWFMLISNLTNNNITRLDFGANLKNNTPTGTLLGGFGSSFNIARSIIITKNCNDLIAYVFNETPSVVKLNFHGSITNHPDSLKTSFGVSNDNSVSSFIYGDTLYGIATSYSPGSIYRLPFLKLNADTTTYNSPVVKHTFTTTGLHNVTLYCDQGNPSGTYAACKSVFVKPPLAVNNISTNKNEIASYPNPATNEWFISIPGSDKNAALYLYALDGKLMQTANLQVGTNKLNIANLHAGYYFYKITNAENVYTGKLLKQ